MNNIKIQPVGFQKKVLNDFLNSKKHLVLNCAIGTGKSWLVSMMAFYQAISKPNQDIIILTPSFAMGFNLYFATGGSQTLRQFCLDNLPEGEVESNEQKMSLIFKNGSKIQILTGSDAKRIQGRNIQLALIDEAAIIDNLDKLIAEVHNRLRPKINSNDEPGRLVAVSTPKDLNAWYDLFTKANANTNDYIVYNVDGYSAGVRDVSFYEKLKDSPAYESDVMVRFITASGGVFNSYNSELHLVQQQYKSDLPLYLVLDYNKNPMTCIVFQKHGKAIYAINEFELFNSNTQEMIDALEATYNRHEKEIILLGDPTWDRGRNVTDKDIVMSKMNSVTGKKFITYHEVPKQQLKDNDGFKHVNKCFREDQLYINTNLGRVIKTLNTCKWIDGSNFNKIKDTEHFADILKYACWQILKKEAGPSETINIF